MHDFSEAYEYAMNILSYREHNSATLKRKLKNKNVSDEEIEPVLEKLKEYKFIDEELFAEHVFMAWMHKKYYGRNHLRIELLKKSVPKELIPQILTMLTREDEEARCEAALALALKKYARRDLKSPEGKAAVMRFLYARGFDSEMIKSVCYKYLR